MNTFSTEISELTARNQAAREAAQELLFAQKRRAEAEKVAAAYGVTLPPDAVIYTPLCVLAHIAAEFQLRELKERSEAEKAPPKAARNHVRHGRERLRSIAPPHGAN